MDIDPLCIPKHNQVYCWHCLSPMSIIRKNAIIKDNFSTRDYSNICYTYQCLNHTNSPIKYSFIEHKGNPHPGYHYICLSNIELVTNIFSGNTWIQKDLNNYKLKIFKPWFAFSAPLEQIIHKVKTYATFY